MDYVTPQRKSRRESVACPRHGWKVIDGILYVQSAAEQAEAA